MYFEMQLFLRKFFPLNNILSIEPDIGKKKGLLIIKIIYILHIIMSTDL